MQFAVDKNQSRIHIDEAIVGEEYYCPCCGSSMIQRRGQINIAHFAHAKGSVCSDNWHYEEMSEWHRNWQSKYPIENREIVIDKDGERHRADVCIRGTVIEFQHSPISLSEFQERNDFYTDAGYKVIWLFDGSAGREKKEEDLNVYLYIQSEDEINDSSGNEALTVEQFIELSSSGRLGHPKLYHTLYKVRRVNNDQGFYGCPVNGDGYALIEQCDNRISCSECEYCLGSNEYSVKCAGRYRSFDINVVLESRSDQLSYIDYDGVIDTVDIIPPPEPGKSIIQIAIEYEADKLIVRNMKSGRAFLITKNPLDYFGKYGKVYGYMRNDTGQFSSKSKEIFYANNPAWIVEWFKKD